MSTQNTASVLVTDTSSIATAIEATQPAKKSGRKSKGKKAEQPAPVETAAAQTAPTTETEEDMDALVARLAAMKAAVKAKQAERDISSRDAELAKQNSAFVPGSFRKATEADKAALAAGLPAGSVVHCHGFVGDIKCEECGATRTVNEQDIVETDKKRGVHFCRGCKAKATRAAAKAKRDAVKNSPEAIKAKMDELKKQLAQLEAK